MFEENTKFSDSFKMSGIKKVEEGLRICGKVRLIGHNKDGGLVFDYEVPNFISNAGFDAICAQIGNPTQPNEFGWMAISNGAVGNAAATTLTATETQRVAATYAHTGGTKIFTITGVFTTVVAALSYGCLNADSNGTLLNQAGFAAATTIDSLTIVATFTLSLGE